MSAQAEGLTADIDEGRLTEMLALVGPASEQHLLRSLIADLTASRKAMLRAITQREDSVVRDQAHVLASLAGTFGAVALSAAVQELEARGLSQSAELDASRVIHRTDRLIAGLAERLAGMAR